jgi:hypothetical protein
MDAAGVVRLGGPAGAGLSVRPPRVILGPEGSDLGQWRFHHWDERSDELEVEWRCGLLRCGIRHRADGEHWNLRAWIANDSSQPAAFAQANLVVDPGQASAWIWPGGVLGLIGLTATACDSLVGLRVRLGELLAVDAQGPGQKAVVEHESILGGHVQTLLEPSQESIFRWLADGYVLGPGQRAVFAAQGRLLDSWAELAGFLPAWLPDLAVPPHGVIEVDQPDGATTAPGAETEDVDGITYVMGSGPVDVTVACPRGRIRLDTYFARDLDDSAGELADRWLDPYFPGNLVGAALTLSSSLPQFTRPRLQEVGQVLVERGVERLEYLLRGTPTVPPTELAFLVAGLDEWGYDVVAESGGRLAPWLVGVAPAGLGLAFIRLWRNRYIAQRDLELVRGLVKEVAPAAAPDWLARLEWSLVRGDDPAAADLRRIMILLGAGLPGQMVSKVAGLAVSDVVVGRAVAVASLIGEQARVPGDWPASLDRAAELAAWRLMARVSDDLVPAAWLALSLL